MKLCGHDDLIRTFTRLTKEKKLSHGYIFFGEPQVGKRTFAFALATFLETGKFENGQILRELFVAEPDEKGTIGIDRVRDLKHFLSQRPIDADHRVAIIDGADALTAHAENAILKIAEEPPEHGLIILVLPYPESLIETLRSRLQRVYFPRLSEKEIEKLLVKEHGVPAKKAREIAEIAFGRPGRAVQLISDERTQTIRKEVLALLSGKRSKKAVIEHLVAEGGETPLFFTDLVAELAKDIEKNYTALASITKRLAAMGQFTTNRRLQLESALWNI